MIEIAKTVSLDAPIRPEDLYGVTFNAENKAHRFIITCQRSGADITLTGIVTAKLIRSDGKTILMQGSINTGKAVVDLHQDCYNISGRFQLAIFNIASGATTCIYACVGNVYPSQSSTLVDSGDVIPNVEEIAGAQATMISNVNTAIGNADAATTRANQAAATAENFTGLVAPTYSTSATYAVGDYVVYNGTMYRCITAIDTAEAWTAAHWTAVNTGAEVTDLKSALTEKEHTVNAELFQSQPYIVRPGLINAAYIWRKTNDDMAHVTIPIFAGDTIEITANSSYDAQYGFLSDNTVTLGQRASLIPDGARYTVTTKETVTATAPEGSNYLYVLYSATGPQMRFPSVLKINGIDRLVSVMDVIKKAETLDKNYRTAIPSGADLDDYVNAGNYDVHNFDTASTISNIPIEQPGILTVSTQKYGSKESITQRYITESATHVRTYTVNTWSAWITEYVGAEFAQDSDSKYRRVANDFTNIFYSNRNIVVANYRASMILELNDGAVVFYDNVKYDATYTVIDKTNYAVMVPNAGWKNTGKLIVDTNGISNTLTVVTLRDNRDASGSNIRIVPLDVNRSTLIMNKIKEVDLFMFMGQSNMAGRGTTNSTWTETYPTIIPCAGLEFKAITDKTRLYPMAEPFGKLENKSGGIDDGSSAPDGGNKTGGLAVAFVNEYYTHTGIPVVGVSASEGGTGIQSWITGTENLTDALQRLSDAVTYLTAENYTIRHKYMLWCQGESDIRLGVTGDQYKAYFDDIMTTMKNAGIEKCFLIRIGEFNGTTYDYSNIINAQTDIAQDRSDTVMATTILASYKDRGMMKDQYHYYQAAYNEMGRYAGINVAEYVNTGKEPTMYDPKNSNLYYCHKN